MKNAFLYTLLLFFSSFSFSQEMNNEILESLITESSDSLIGQQGRWQFYVDETTFICLTDETHNRMRIISPIMEAANLSNDLKNAALIANFHTALDVKYAIAEDVLWSVFIHPLRELSEDQVKDAIKQVYAANLTFGTSFSSTDLIFPGATKERDSIPKKSTIKKEKF
ncbi:MAG: hypothetical protein ACWA5P_12030 [bacterium]